MDQSELKQIFLNPSAMKGHGCDLQTFLCVRTIVNRIYSNNVKIDNPLQHLKKMIKDINRNILLCNMQH